MYAIACMNLEHTVMSTMMKLVSATQTGNKLKCSSRVNYQVDYKVDNKQNALGLF